MNSILFLGTKIGHEGLTTLINVGANINQVFVDNEHNHEIEKYSQRIIELCEKHSIPVVENAKEEEISQIINNLNIDYIFCLGFRRLIEDKILCKAKKAACSTHFSLLPKYRGFAPINWAIINGEKECGVSLFHMEAEADSGDIVAQKHIAIADNEYADDIMNKCIDALKEILIEEWPELSNGKVKRIKQDDSQATFTCARNPEDGIIDWNQSTEVIYNLIRGTSYPFPGAFTFLNSEKLTIWTAEPYGADNFVGRIPGKVIQLNKNKGVVVLTGNGALLIKKVQLMSAREAQSADQIIKSVRVTLGR